MGRNGPQFLVAHLMKVALMLTPVERTGRSTRVVPLIAVIASIVAWIAVPPAAVETVEPLAAAMGVDVQQDIKDKDFEDLVDEVFSDPAYRGRTVVICWHHGTLPAIAALLGAPAGSYPDPWPDNAYNIILDFSYDPNSGKPPTVTRVTEPF